MTEPSVNAGAPLPEPDPDVIVGDMGGGRIKAMKVNYPSNAKKDAGKPKAPLTGNPEAVEQPRAEKVIQGKAVQRKKGLGKKLSDSIISDESGSVSDYIVSEVLVPAAKNMISDTIKMITDSIFQGFEQALFGNARPRRSTDGPNRVQYNRVARPTSSYSDRRPTETVRTGHNFDDILLETRGDAEDVLDKLREVVDMYEVASVRDLYDACGLTGTFADENWGWTDLRSATVRLARGGGYILVLPRPRPLAQS